MERMCQPSLANVEAILPAELVEFVGVEQYAAVDSYIDLGRTMLNSIEVRHIQYETRIEPLPGVDIEVVPYMRADEYWLTPEGQLVQHRRMDTHANTVGVATIELLGIVSGVGEPNVIEAPVLPTPAP